MNQPIAIQSWCYRNFKEIPAFIEQLKSTGVSATELCGVHADFSKPDTFGKVIEQFKKANVQLVCIGVEYLSGNLETDRPRFEFCKQAGIKHMSISFQPESMWDGLKNIEKLAEQYDLKLSIHNHGGYDWLGNAKMLEHIFNTTSERIGLCIDTAWCLQAAQDPVEWAGKFSKRLFGVHIKDFTFDRAGKWTDVIVGTGNLKLKEFLHASLAAPHLKNATLEYEGDVNNPGPALKECVTAVHAAI